MGVAATPASIPRPAPGDPGRERRRLVRANREGEATPWKTLAELTPRGLTETAGVVLVDLAGVVST